MVVIEPGWPVSIAQECIGLRPAQRAQDDAVGPHAQRSRDEIVGADLRRSRQMRIDMICEANDIEHRLTKPNHPWTNGQVERMNRTIREATVQRFHDESRDQLRTRFADFMAADNFARPLKTPGGLTPSDSIANAWTSEPGRFIVSPIHQMPGLAS